MRILYVAPYLPSLLRIRPLNFIRQIVVRGHEVEALILGARPADGEASQQLEALGQGRTAALFPKDHTHTSAEGAELVAQCVVESLRSAKLPLGAFLKP